MAYSQDKLTFQFFDQHDKQLCDLQRITLSTKLRFNPNLADVGATRKTQILEKPYTFAYDKLAESNGKPFLGINLFQEKVVRSRIAAGLFEACNAANISVDEIHWYFRTGVPVEYKMFKDQIIGFLRETITTKQYNSDSVTRHKFVNVSCDEQPKFAAQSLFYETNSAGLAYKEYVNGNMTVCAVDCGSQVCNFTKFGTPGLQIKKRSSAKVGTWSLIGEHIRPLLCMEEAIDFADDYDVIRALRDRKIGNTPISDKTIAKLRKQVFGNNFPLVLEGIEKIVPDVRLLDMFLLYGGSSYDYIDHFKQHYVESDVVVMIADNPVHATADGMAMAAMHHYRKEHKQ